MIKICINLVIVYFWTTLEAEKIDARKKKPEANFFGSEGFNSTQLFWILKTQKTLAEGFFFLNSQFWSWKGVQNELFLYWITFLPCSYEAKVKNKILFFPREKRNLFFPDSPNTIRIGAEKKSNPLYKKSNTRNWSWPMANHTLIILALPTGVHTGVENVSRMKMKPCRNFDTHLWIVIINYFGEIKQLVMLALKNDW